MSEYISTPNLPESRPSIKHTRTSSRTIVLDEVQDLITHAMSSAAMLSDFNAATALRNLSEKVEELRNGHPKNKTVKAARKLKMGISGTHFVGIRGDETPVYVHRSEDFSAFTAVYGSFNTHTGASYAIEHKTYTNKPRVM